MYEVLLAKFERKLSYNRDIVLTSLSAFVGNNFLSSPRFEGLTPLQIAENITGCVAQVFRLSAGKRETYAFNVLSL